jgi:hypothetical protein
MSTLLTGADVYEARGELGDRLRAAELLYESRTMFEGMRVPAWRRNGCRPCNVGIEPSVQEDFWTSNAPCMGVCFGLEAPVMIPPGDRASERSVA